MNRRIVNVHQDIVKLELGTLDKLEYNVLFAIMHQINNQADTDNIIPMSTINKITGLENNRCRNKLQSLSAKLSNLHMVDRRNGKITQNPFKIFSKFTITEKTVKVQVSQQALYLFGTSTRYTSTGGFFSGCRLRIDLQDFLRLKKYEKYIYLLLLQFVDRGERKIDLELFRRRTGQAEKTWKYLNQKIINPALDDLSDHYYIYDVTRVKNDEMGILHISYYQIDRATGELIEPEHAKKLAEKPAEPEPGKPDQNIIDITDYLDAPIEPEYYDTPAIDDPDAIDAYYDARPIDITNYIVEPDPMDAEIDYTASAISVWDAIADVCVAPAEPEQTQVIVKSWSDYV